jgi:hypothetical protein
VPRDKHQGFALAPSAQTPQKRSSGEARIVSSRAPGKGLASFFVPRFCLILSFAPVSRPCFLAGLMRPRRLQQNFRAQQPITLEA